MEELMLLDPLTAQSLTAFFATLVAIIAGAPVARKLGFIDAPSKRKRHVGEVPTIGGIAIFMSLTLVGALWGDVNATLITVNGNDALWVFLGCGAFLVFTGALDDRWRLGVFIRILSEVLVAIAVIELLDLKVAHLGDLFGSGLLQLDPALAYPFTVISIFGVMNAFYMMDGIDGLLASLVILTLVLFHLFTATQPGFVSLAIGASLLAFLVSNLGLSPLVPRTFLGDAGSKLLGFIVVCLLLAAASAQVGKIKLIQPATALFVVAIPLYDMVFTSLRRIIRRGSPFSADRSHIHHLMQDLGFSDQRSLVIILGIHSSVALLGLVLHRAATPEYYQFAIFVGCFGLYALLASQLWVAATKLQDAQLRLAAHHEPDTTADNKVIKDHTGDKRYPKKLDSKNFTRMNRR